MPKVNSIKVRMYRHGFGDCFLLQFFAGRTRTLSMLIDCGLKKNDSVDGVTLVQVVDDIKKQLKGKGKSKAKPKLDILVATHEHWDHVSGFHPSAKLFDNISIEQIWMAWTEDPEDDEAEEINSSIKKRIKALKIASERIKKSTSENASFYQTIQYGDTLLRYRKEFENSLSDVLGFFGPLAATKTKVSTSGIKFKDKFKISIDTQDAIDHLRSLAKKGSGIKYFEPGTSFVDEHKLPGIRIYILGPPKGSLLNKDKPSTGEKKEVYFGIYESSMVGFVNGLLHFDDADQDYEDDGKPFRDVNIITAEEAQKHEYLKRTYFDPSESWRTVESDWLNIAGALALQMDSDTNNTSLVLAIEMVGSDKVLLFPGDAQVGNWLSWHDYSWEVNNGTGTESINATRLLTNTVLYKVGHHASHNATLRDKGLELMKHKDLVALVPEKEKQYNGIPFGPLVKELNKKTKGRLIFSADKNHKAENVLVNKPDELSAAEWKQFKSNTTITKLFVEYNVNR